MIKPHDFRAISKDRHLEISSKGGLACHASGNAFGFTKKSASEAGKKGAEKRKEVTDWMDKNKSNYEDALDLASDCCSTFSCWKDDLSIPAFIMRKAKRIFGKEVKY